MSNVSRGFAYEREVKQHFVKAGWGCTRAAHSASVMDLIAFRHSDDGPYRSVIRIFKDKGYQVKDSKSKNIPMHLLASKIEKRNVKHTYFDIVMGHNWTVVLMQCKIRKR